MMTQSDTVTQYRTADSAELKMRKDSKKFEL